MNAVENPRVPFLYVLSMSVKKITEPTRVIYSGTVIGTPTTSDSFHGKEIRFTKLPEDVHIVHLNGMDIKVLPVLIENLEMFQMAATESAYIMPTRAAQEILSEKERAESICKNALKNLTAIEAVEVLEKITQDVMLGRSIVDWGSRDKHPSSMY